MGPRGWDSSPWSHRLPSLQPPNVNGYLGGRAESLPCRRIRSSTMGPAVSVTGPSGGCCRRTARATSSAMHPWMAPHSAQGCRTQCERACPIASSSSPQMAGCYVARQQYCICFGDSGGGGAFLVFLSVCSPPESAICSMMVSPRSVSACSAGRKNPVRCCHLFCDRASIPDVEGHQPEAHAREVG